MCRLKFSLTQRGASLNRVHKRWRIVTGEVSSWIEVSVWASGHQFQQYSHNITGASPAYVEALVERLNIHINNLLYELGRIPR